MFTVAFDRAFRRSAASAGRRDQQQVVFAQSGQDAVGVQVLRFVRCENVSRTTGTGTEKCVLITDVHLIGLFGKSFY